VENAMTAQLNSLDWLVIGLLILVIIGLVCVVREDNRAWQRYLDEKDKDYERQLRRRNNLG
jgi:hypothetical protein